MTLNRGDSSVSNELIRTGQWIQDNRGELVSPQTARFWPNSNQTTAQVTSTRDGCFRAPRDDDSTASVDTAAVLENMTYVGGMNYAKYRLEASRAKSAGKQKKTRPPTLCVQEELAVTVPLVVAMAPRRAPLHDVPRRTEPLRRRQQQGPRCSKRKLKPSGP